MIIIELIPRQNVALMGIKDLTYPTIYDRLCEAQGLQRVDLTKKKNMDMVRNAQLAHGARLPRREQTLKREQTRRGQYFGYIAAEDWAKMREIQRGPVQGREEW